MKYLTTQNIVQFLNIFMKKISKIKELNDLKTLLYFLKYKVDNKLQYVKYVKNVN